MLQIAALKKSAGFIAQFRPRSPLKDSVPFPDQGGIFAAFDGLSPTQISNVVPQHETGSCLQVMSSRDHGSRQQFNMLSNPSIASQGTHDGQRRGHRGYHMIYLLVCQLLSQGSTAMFCETVFHHNWACCALTQRPDTTDSCHKALSFLCVKAPTTCS